MTAKSKTWTKGKKPSRNAAAGVKKRPGPRRDQTTMSGYTNPNHVDLHHGPDGDAAGDRSVFVALAAGAAAVAFVLGLSLGTRLAPRPAQPACVAALDGYRYSLGHPTAPDALERATRAREDEATCRSN